MGQHLFSRVQQLQHLQHIVTQHMYGKGRAICDSSPTFIFACSTIVTQHIVTQHIKLYVEEVIVAQHLFTCVQQLQHL